MASSAELHAVAELNHANAIAIFLAKQGNGTQFLGFLDGDVAVVLKDNVLADAAIDDACNFAQLLGCYLLEVGEVKAQVFGCYKP